MTISGIQNFIGITIGENSNCDSGICILNIEDEIIRIDKAYTIDELTQTVNSVSGKQNSVICIDLPEFYEMLEGKWRIVNKNTQPLTLDNIYPWKDNWGARYSDRGGDFCKKLIAECPHVYRYCSNYIKTMLNLHPYMKERTPVGCKFLQMAIKEKLGIKNFPPNMLPVSVLDAILGAYLAKTIATGTQGANYDFNYKYKEFDIANLI